MGFSETTLPPIVTAMFSQFLTKPFTVQQISGKNQTFPFYLNQKLFELIPALIFSWRYIFRKKFRILLLPFLATINKRDSKLISQSKSGKFDYSSFSFGDSCPFQILACTVKN